MLVNLVESILHMKGFVGFSSTTMQTYSQRGSFDPIAPGPMDALLYPRMVINFGRLDCYGLLWAPKLICNGDALIAFDCFRDNLAGASEENG